MNDLPNNGRLHRDVGDIARLANDWARFPGFWEPKVSPDGRWVGWTWTGVTETGDVWIAPADGSAPPRRLTEETEHTYVRAFSRDGRLVLLAQSAGASEHDHLVLVDLETGARRVITAPQDDHYVFGGTFTPDARHILYAASYDDRTNSPIDGQRIYRHDIETGERRIVGGSDTLESRPIELDDEGRFILYQRRAHPAGSQVWLLDLSGGEDREILNVGPDRKAYGSWLGPGVVLVRAECESHDRIGLLRLPQGDVDWLIDDPRRSIENAVPGADGRSVAVADFQEGVLRASLLDSVTRIERPLGVENASLLPIDQLASGEWIAERYNSAGPHELVRIDPVTGRHVGLSRSADHLPRAGLGCVQAAPWSWASVDGMRIGGWLYEPKGHSRGLVVHIHGGPTWHSENWIETEIQFLAAAGFTVLDPNYRGSTGYGRPFREAIKADGWGGREQADIRAGIESLLAAGKARKGRIAVAGLSYGGYSSWYQVTRSADLVDAAIPICGMYHLTIDYDQTGMPHGRAFSEEMMGGTPAEQPQRYFNASPANFIDRIRGRLLIVHGLRDTNVSPENSYAAARDLDRAGIPYELLTFPDEGHGIHRAGNREALFRRMAEFLNEAFKKG